MNDQNPNGVLSRLRKLPRAVAAAFVCCFLAGYLAHLFAYTNIFPNPDGISRVADAQQMTISGRWFLHYATAWNGFVQAPAVIGFFSILFLSLASVLTVSLLRVRAPVLGGLIGALMVVFPSVAYMNLYLFTASAYCFGILLAVLSVWLATRYRFGFLGGAVCLACAVGTYQAYLAVAVSLALLWLILEGLEGERGAGKLLLAALQVLIFIGLSMGLYFLMLKIFLAVKELSLLSYKGINALGEGLSLKGLLSMIGLAYRQFLQYFFVPRAFATYTGPAAVFGNAVLLLAGLWAFVELVRRKRCMKRPGAFALTLLFCALLPLALNLTSLMGESMPIMRYSFVFAYVLALALADRAAQSLPLAGKLSAQRTDEVGRKPASLQKKKGQTAPPPQAETPLPQKRALIPHLAALFASLLLLLLSFQTDNTVYTMSATAHRATESFATRLVERVESTPGYVNGMEVVIIGGFPRRVYYNQIEAFRELEDYSNLSSTVTPLTKQVYYYLNDWLNVPWPEPSEDTLKAVSASAAFQSMPLYPNDGSIRIEGDRVIVKLASKYTPKKDYEIEYENRR